MSRLHLVSSSFVAPVVQSLLRQGSSLHPLFRQAKLSMTSFEQQRGMVPLEAGKRLLDLVLRHTGDPLFCARVVLDTAADATEQLDVIQQPQRTPLESIQAVIARLDTMTPEGVSWYVQGGLLWLVRRPVANSPGEGWGTEQLSLAVFTRVLNRYLPSWKPACLCLHQTQAPPALAEFWREVPLTLGQRYTGIAVSLNTLVHGDEVSSAKAWAKPSAASTSSDTIGLQGILWAYMDDTQWGFNDVADAFGMSPRSFRRHLQAQGLSYARLLDEHRVDQALRGLADPDLPITTLAFDLGYEHLANFSRAFRRRMGVAPVAYRRMLLSGEIGNLAADDKC